MNIAASQEEDIHSNKDRRSAIVFSGCQIDSPQSDSCPDAAPAQTRVQQLSAAVNVEIFSNRDRLGGNRNDS